MWDKFSKVHQSRLYDQQNVIRAVYFTDVVEMVAKSGDNPYRPEIPKSADAAEINPSTVDLMKECWNEDPDQRPDFSKIISKLKAINKGKWVLHVDKVHLRSLLKIPLFPLYRTL